jgi:hypothetical protein
VSAIDELRFGPGRTLNLRESLPTAAEAVRRAENYLREHQIKGSGEVLIITGRGLNSPDGIGVVRAAVEKLLHSLRRRGVVESHAAHNPGAFAVRLAPIRSLADAPRRNRERERPLPAPVHGLGAEASELLRQLAERALDELGVTHDAGAIADEMQRQLRAITPGLPGGDKMEAALSAALRRALDDYDR